MKAIMRCIVFFIVLTSLILTGCAPGQKAFDKGQTAYSEQKYDQALSYFQQAVQKEPDRQEYRMMLLNARQQAALMHLRLGEKAVKENDLKTAERAFLLARSLAPEIPAAQHRLQALQKQRILEDQKAQARKLIQGKSYREARHTLMALLQIAPQDPEVQALLSEVEQVMIDSSLEGDGPLLPLASRDPISIDFKKTDLRKALKILSRLSGINFVPNYEVRNQPVDLTLYDVTPAQALEVVLNLNQLSAKQLNDKTLLIYPKSKANDKKFDDYQVKSFYLSHISAKKAVNMLKSLLKAKSIFVHEERNALIVRDKPELLAVAARLIEAADRAEAEVMFEVEVIEVSHDDNQLLGPQLSPYSISGGLAKAGTVVASSLESGKSSANLVTGLSNLGTVYTLPTATFDFQKTLVDTEILANPKVRVKNGSKAKVHVGTREPVITVTTTGDSSSENVQYIDVGVKLDIQPTVDLDGTVVTNLKLEVSNVVERTQTANGTLVLSISTTNAESTLILKDGERAVVGGLIRNDRTKTRKSIAGLGDIPLLGDLLSNHNTDTQKREILLSIKPHILRQPDLPDPRLATTWSGSLTEIKPGPAFESFLTPVDESRPTRSSDATDVSSTAPVTRVETQQVQGEKPIAARIDLSAPTAVTRGEPFDVLLTGTDLKDIASGVIGITYDPAALEWQTTSEGTLLSTPEGKTLFTSNRGPVPGTVLVGTKAMPPQPNPGNGLIGTLTFRSLKAGPTTLRIHQMQVRNTDGQTLQPNTRAITLNVQAQGENN